HHLYWTCLRLVLCNGRDGMGATPARAEDGRACHLRGCRAGVRHGAYAPGRAIRPMTAEETLACTCERGLTTFNRSSPCRRTGSHAAPAKSPGSPSVPGRCCRRHREAARPRRYRTCPATPR